MNWEDINKKHNFDFNRLIMCMPDDVRKEIDQLWNGGELNPYNAAERVLQQRAMSDKPVDLVEIDRLYEEKFVCKQKPRKPKRKSFADFVTELGEKTASRAEVLAAMDCLMHHLKDEDDFYQWTANAIKDEQNWNLLDWDPGEGARRCKAYMDIARHMDDHSFECVCRTFADIVRGQCFTMEYREGAFSFESGLRKNV